MQRHLEVTFKPDLASDYPMKVLVSPPMIIQDTKEIHFWQNGLTDYKNCHRRASTYAVVQQR